MTDPVAGGPGDVTRPDHEATLNEAGLEVFAVDGTDSFAVPGPADGQVAEEAPVPPPISRTRVLVTAGAVVAGLAFVVAVGAGSAQEPSLRTGAEGAGPGFSTPLWRTDDDEVDLGDVTLEPYDAETLALLEEGRAADGDDDSAFDDEYAYDDDFDSTATTFSPTDTVDPFDDEFFDSFEDDDDFTYRPSNTVARRVTPTRRSVITVPRRVTTVTTTTTTVPTTTTTSVPTTTTTTTTTTTVEAATTSSSTTAPTTQPPPPVWAVAAKGLPECPANLQVWARGDGLVAASGGSLFQRTTGDWTPLGAALPAATRITAFVPGANDSTYWVGTDAGVFAVTGGGTPAALGVLADVQSLAVAPNGQSLLAVTGGAALHRWDAATSEWTPAPVPVQGATFGTVLFLDDSDALLGTSAGVLRTDDGGATWTSVSSEPVVGRPVHGQNTFYWLRPAGAGVLRSTALDGLTWTAYAGDGALGDGFALAVRPNQVLAWGDPAGGQPRLVASTDGGASWAPVEPTTPYRPDGLVHVGDTTYAFTADCDAGTAGGADSVLRLADP